MRVWHKLSWRQEQPTPAMKYHQYLLGQFVLDGVLRTFITATWISLRKTLYVSLCYVSWALPPPPSLSLFLHVVMDMLWLVQGGACECQSCSSDAIYLLFWDSVSYCPEPYQTGRADNLSAPGIWLPSHLPSDGIKSKARYNWILDVHAHF